MNAKEFLRAKGVWERKVELPSGNDMELSELMEQYANQQPAPANEWIICSAIQYFIDGKEVIVCGLRHNNCINTYYELTGKQTDCELEQGFLTSTGRFVDRIEAGKIALSCGQIKELKYYGGTKLDSSDLYQSLYHSANQQPVNDVWVRVDSGKLPERNRFVLLNIPLYNNQCTGYWDGDSFTKHDMDIFGEVTHWRPLPEPPKQ